jgi:hypothetical protein
MGQFATSQWTSGPSLKPSDLTRMGSWELSAQPKTSNAGPGKNSAQALSFRCCLRLGNLRSLYFERLFLTVAHCPNILDFSVANVFRASSIAASSGPPAVETSA